LIRVAIIGNSGPGKSTLARRLAAAAGVDVLDLDAVAWEPGKVAVARPLEAALADVEAFCASRAGWVVEGCYAGLVRAALAYRPRLLFLDPGVERCLANCRSRPWEPHKYASPAEQDARLDVLLAWVRDDYTRDGDLSLRAHAALFDPYAGPRERLTELPGPGFPPHAPDA
jgi:adenylate kinase family enzyme